MAPVRRNVCCPEGGQTHTVVNHLLSITCCDVQGALSSFVITNKKMTTAATFFTVLKNVRVGGQNILLNNGFHAHLHTNLLKCSNSDSVKVNV